MNRASGHCIKLRRIGKIECVHKRTYVVVCMTLRGFFKSNKKKVICFLKKKKCLFLSQRKNKNKYMKTCSLGLGQTCMSSER